jgi:hypothetical protein
MESPAWAITMLVMVLVIMVMMYHRQLKEAELAADSCIG